MHVRNNSITLPPDLKAFTSLLDAQPPEVQEAFQFLLATAMHEGGHPRFGKFELLNVVEVCERMPILNQARFSPILSNRGIH